MRRLYVARPLAAGVRRVPIRCSGSRVPLASAAAHAGRLSPGPVQAGMAPGIRAVRWCLPRCWPGRPRRCTMRSALAAAPARAASEARPVAGATPGEHGQPGRHWRRSFWRCGGLCHPDCRAGRLRGVAILHVPLSAPDHPIPALARRRGGARSAGREDFRWFSEQIRTRTARRPARWRPGRGSGRGSRRARRGRPGPGRGAARWRRPQLRGVAGRAGRRGAGRGLGRPRARRGNRRPGGGPGQPAVGQPPQRPRRQHRRFRQGGGRQPGRGDRLRHRGELSGGGADYATVAYDAATGAQRWASRYNGPANRDDFALSVAVSPDGATVFVTGASFGGRNRACCNSDWDYATVAYDAATGAQRWASRYNGPANSR